MSTILGNYVTQLLVSDMRIWVRMGTFECMVGPNQVLLTNSTLEQKDIPRKQHAMTKWEKTIKKKLRI